MKCFQRGDSVANEISIAKLPADESCDTYPFFTILVSSDS
jgi:hypothetical protein